jgi:hypothetical protein
VQQAKGVLKKPPAVTWEAKQALKDIHTDVPIGGMTSESERQLGAPSEIRSNRCTLAR